MIAFIYDLQYKISFEILKEKDYFNKIIDRFDFKENQTKESILDIVVLLFLAIFWINWSPSINSSLNCSK